MACLNAAAMAVTSPAVAMAVLAMTAAAPISMASHACDGRPMPASTITGKSISSMRIWMNSRVASPLFEPMGEPSGMMHAAPALAMSRAALRSGYMYGMTTKPSSASTSQALAVS